MLDVIHLLPDAVANQIAAGEVVQRPASVIKELLENSLDAGAKNIKVIIKESGKTFIQVTDDGIGMTERDARMCFERHATSKISKAQDLYCIKSMGFRGEALASIASVAMVELRTKRKDDANGTLIVMEGGELKIQEPCSCNNGTSITVKNLFYNIPVRRNFLKSNQIEYKHIIDEFFHAAIPNPEVRFILSSEKNEVFHLIKSSLKNRLVALLGKRYESQLISVQEETHLVKISGFSGKPESAKKSRGEQFFFVNNRFIKSNFFNHAVTSAYEAMIPSDSFPFYVLFLEVPYEKVDVNVHPTKTEVKFQEEKEIYHILKASVKKALGQVHLAPSLDFEHESFLNNLKNIENTKISDNLKLKITTGRDFQHSNKVDKFTTRQSVSQSEWKQLYEILESKNIDEKPKQKTIPEQNTEIEEKWQIPENKFIQLHNKYIFTTLQSGFLVVHQQHAHQRILYEELLSLFKKENNPSQKQIFPEVIEFPENDFQIFSEIQENMEHLGFSFDKLGKRTIAINGVPAGIKIINVKEYIESVIEEYLNSFTSQDTDLKENLAKAISLKSSVKSGEILSKEEMSALIDNLFACENPYYSPKGKAVFLKVDKTELDKKFE